MLRATLTLAACWLFCLPAASAEDLFRRPSPTQAKNDIQSLSMALYRQTGDPIFLRMATDPYYASRVATDPVLLERVASYLRKPREHTVPPAPPSDSRSDPGVVSLPSRSARNPRTRPNSSESPAPGVGNPQFDFEKMRREMEAESFEPLEFLWLSTKRTSELTEAEKKRIQRLPAATTKDLLDILKKHDGMSDQAWAALKPKLELIYEQTRLRIIQGGVESMKMWSELANPSRR